jgi:hypothetical protein
MITNVSVEGHECFASLSMASPSGGDLCNDGTEPSVNHFTKCELCMTWSDVTEIVVTGPSAEPLRTSRDLLSFSEEARASKTSRC